MTNQEKEAIKDLLGKEIVFEINWTKEEREKFEKLTGITELRENYIKIETLVKLVKRQEEIINEKDKTLSVFNYCIKCKNKKECFEKHWCITMDRDGKTCDNFKEILINDKAKQELLNLIVENPDLPFVFFVDNGDLCADYGSTVMEDYIPYISEIYKYKRFGELNYSDDIDELIEYYSEVFADEEEYEKMSDEEYSEAIKNYINENIEHYKAIVVKVW